MTRLDPATGLPVAVPEAEQWKDPDWPEPKTVLTNVTYDGVPLSEVAIHLRDQFKEHFDVLLPVNVSLPSGTEALDIGSIPVRLRLKNVTASEVFNAMNLVFENDRTPLRWELKMNGSRPIVLLRVLGLPREQERPAPRPEVRRMVYFVGDLLGDPKGGGMTLKQVVDTLSEVSGMAHGQPIDLQFHEAAQLVVASGTPEQLRFLDMTLSALRKKAELDRKGQPKSAETSSPPASQPGEKAAPK